MTKKCKFTGTFWGGCAESELWGTGAAKQAGSLRRQIKRDFEISQLVALNARRPHHPFTMFGGLYSSSIF